MNLSIHQYRAPRSGFPQESVFARVTARVTTFSFPLFSLSDAPPGRSSGECCLAAHSRHRGKSLLKIASAGRIRDCVLRLASLGDLRHLRDSRRLAFACPFEPPRVGVPRIIQMSCRDVKLFRLIFSQISLLVSQDIDNSRV